MNEWSWLCIVTDFLLLQCDSILLTSSVVRGTKDELTLTSIEMEKWVVEVVRSI